MKPKLLLFLFITLFSACVSPPAQTDYVGSYEGASIHKSKEGQSLVLQLDVTNSSGAYSLVGSMNDTNREEGMDHTSNTRWQWSGKGIVHEGCLRFKYRSHGAERENGTLRRDNVGFRPLAKNTFRNSA